MQVAYSALLGLQALARRWLAMWVQVREARREGAAGYVQAYVRGWQARQYARVERAGMDRMAVGQGVEQRVVQMQAGVRGWAARRMARRIMVERAVAAAGERVRMWKSVIAAVEWEAQEGRDAGESIARMQAGVRGWMARRSYRWRCAALEFALEQLRREELRKQAFRRWRQRSEQAKLLKALGVQQVDAARQCAFGRWRRQVMQQRELGQLACDWQCGVGLAMLEASLVSQVRVWFGRWRSRCQAELRAVWEQLDTRWASFVGERRREASKLDAEWDEFVGRRQELAIAWHSAWSVLWRR